ncbi:extracellular solute-binding protein [Arthrobacter sp. S39]|uniref:sugar ABC transporter substrate-binding protein n=1 Tax=Arthrobacter sp. S39 TaxID=2509720 RepID=UPI0010376DED|nr:extracellular solute-binding protein [Arthrobacter sp. S39]TAP44586.1 extracellular solute-binding protein [Arthrobacter sp. S39]
MKTPRASRLAAVITICVSGALGLSACGSGFASPSANESSDAGSGPISVLIASSGDAEATAVKAAVADWSKTSGTEASVNVASDLIQQLSQGFASGKPADVFYLSPDQLSGYASNGSLEPYADSLANKGDFQPSLTRAFTFDGKFYCAPKDSSTLSLVINNDLWQAAGLTDADIPATWDELEATAKKLTSGNTVGLSFSPEVARVAAFFPQAGGSLLSSDGKTATVNSTENVKALTFVKKMLTDGSAKFSSDLGAGWGGEAFGKQLSAMTIEGNWISGALSKDFPSIKYRTVELPAGPKGKGTLQFTNCWGIAADSKNKPAAKALVEQLTGTQTQMTFAKAFGVMPSVISAESEFRKEFPEQEASIAGVEYAQTLPSQPGAADVLKDFNAKLATLQTSDPKAILDAIQAEMTATLSK